MNTLFSISAFLLLASLRISIAHTIPFEHTPLTGQEDLSVKMVEGIHQFLIHKIQEKKEDRNLRWMEALQGINSDAFLSENRTLLKERLGVTVTRDRPKMEVMTDSLLHPIEINTENVTLKAVRWNVHGSLFSEGLYLEPVGSVRGRMVLIPDADLLPEELAGFTKKDESWSGIAFELAMQGIEVIIPALIDRGDAWSGNSQLGRWTNQPHREWLYRQSYELGRHLIGEEIQKILSAVDWFKNKDKDDALPVGVMGYGEGGLLAFYAGALDRRISSALVSGYFDQREEVWKEPIYRNTFGVLAELGDAEVALLYSDRCLVVEHCKFPKVEGPPEPTSGRKGAAPGWLLTPSYAEIEEEWNRIGVMQPDAKENYDFINAFNENDGNPFSILAIQQFTEALGLDFESRKKVQRSFPRPDQWINPRDRQKRLVLNMQEVFQREMNRCEITRDTFFWDKVEKRNEAGRTNIEADFRDKLWNTLGRLPDPNVPIDPRARMVEKSENWTRYEVVLQVWPDVFAWGLLTVPHGIKEGEKRPVVVCQHGLEGLPKDVVITDPDYKKYGAYKGYATQLAERGYITFAPHNPYRGGDKFRVLQRMANPIGYSLFSVIIGQHQRILEWLKGLDFVDGERIGFYGLSYGGKAAMRIPAVLEGYALSICSGDFNEWIRKNVSVDLKYSYMFTGEYEMSEWNLGQTFNYAEMAALIAPRPFMIEFGYRDGIGSVEWVNYEFGKVRRHYDLKKISEKLQKEFFDGPHSIHGVGTFQFLDHHLKK